MGLRVTKVRSAAERDRLFEFRYRIYVEEARIPTSQADHATRRLKDPLDECSTSYVMLDEEQIAGELRVTWLGDVPEPTEITRTFGMRPAIDAFGPEAICKTSRFILDPKWRQGTAIYLLMETAYEEGWTQGGRLNYGDCSPHLLPFYEHLGFRRYTGAFEDPDYGFKFPILMIADLDYFRRARSPLARVAKRLGEDREACEWFAQTYPDRLVPPTAIFLPEGEFFNLLRARLGTDPTRHIRLLRGLERREFEALFSRATLVNAKSGCRIVRRGDPSDTLFLLLSGLAETTCDDISGAPVRRFRPGDFVGGTAFFSGDERRFTDVLVREPCEVVVLPGDSLRRFIANEPAAAAKVLANARAIDCLPGGLSTNRDDPEWSLEPHFSFEMPQSGCA